MSTGVITRGGAQLHYDDTGSGGLALLFLHPWSGDRSFFAPQVAAFSDSHRCVSLDLRGHGASGTPLDGYAMESLAADVAAVCDAIELGPAVVVGHSMGGIVGVHLAAQRPDLLRAVVVLDSPLLPPAAFGAMVPPLIEGMRSPSFRAVTRQFQGQFAGFADDPVRREALLDRLCAGEQHVKVATLEHVFGDDNESALRACPLPVLYVGSGAGFADLDLLRAACPQLEVAEVVGAGHFVQLEVPEQVNPLLADFLSRVG